MAVNIPGLSLSLLRQQTSVQAGLPLLISGRFTAFGMGVPTFIRVFLEGPSYDPQLRSFDTFASPFSGDYSTNIIAEKDGQYNVYAQAFPPPLIPTGPPFPEAIMLLPPIAESTRPPLVVGYPFDGGVDALLPDGTRQRLTAPPMQPIEFRPVITVAPGITVTAPGVPAAYPRIPAYPPAVPPAPPPAVPPVAVITRAAVDDIRFSPEEINPGMEATGVMSWRNIGDAPHIFDTVFYLVSPVGVRYGPLQVNQDISANPQVPATQNLRLSTAGMPSGIYSVVAEIYDSTTGALLAAQTLPNRLQIREIAVPVVPVPPPPVVPVPPTIDILGTPTLNLPSQIQVGDAWAGSVSLPTFATEPVFIESRLLLRDAQGYEYIVGQGGRTLYPGEYLQVPVNFDTSGFSAGNYTILLRVFDQAGNQIAEFPMGVLSMIEAVIPVIPPPVVPPPTVPTAPTLPIADMFRTPSVNLPTEVEIGEIWSGNVSIPTQLPLALQGIPSLPSYPVDIGLQLESPIGQLINVGTYRPTFSPGQTINLPVNFDTSVLPQEGIHNLIMNISDIQGNTLFSNIIGTLRALMPAIPPVPTPPAPPVPPVVPVPSEFTDITVQMGAQQVQVGGSVTIPFTYTHVGAEEVVTLHAAIGDARPAYLGGFDEVWWAAKTVTVPPHAVPTAIRDSITIPITAKLAAAGIYSVYAKVDGGIPRAISPILTNIIEVVEPAAPPPILPGADIADFNINLITVGPFDPGSTASVIATGRYRGRAQGGSITISLGTGVPPTFFSRFTVPIIPVNFNEAYDWQDFSFRANFTIPTNVELGQTYNLRATIQTFMEPTQETETDWGVIEITAPPAIPSSQFSRVEIDPALGFPVVHHGETLQVPINYTHLGQRDTARVYAAIGEWGTVFGFDEMAHGETSITVPDDSVLRTRQATVNITIPTLKAGRYDLYAKVDGEQSSPVLGRVHVVEVVPVPPSRFSAIRVTPMISTVHRGEPFTIFVYYTHEGEAESEWLYASIGNTGVFGFDEIESNRKVITVPVDTAPVERVEAIDVPTNRLSPGTYDIYAKIGSVISPTVENVVTIIP